ncbi:hypothetical protein B0H13DRAFT_2319892 [Mycena leptocephala]|nr:hypothetical protein B0H13DRAFT_2319892 [Mycena leptocephala]
MVDPEWSGFCHHYRSKAILLLPLERSIDEVPLATEEEDDIPRRIFELEGEDSTVASTFNRRVDILFGEHVRDSDGRLKYVRRGNLGMDCVVKYLESIHWESAKIPLDLAQGKLARIADGDREPTKPAGKIAGPRPSFTQDAGYEKKMDVLFAASTTTTAQKKSKLKSTNETDDSEDDLDDVIEIDRPDPPAVKDTFSQLATFTAFWQVLDAPGHRSRQIWTQASMKLKLFSRAAYRRTSRQKEIRGGA